MVSLSKMTFGLCLAWAFLANAEETGYDYSKCEKGKTCAVYVEDATDKFTTAEEADAACQADGGCVGFSADTSSSVFGLCADRSTGDAPDTYVICWAKETGYDYSNCEKGKTCAVYVENSTSKFTTAKDADAACQADGRCVGFSADTSSSVFGLCSDRSTGDAPDTYVICWGNTTLDSNAMPSSGADEPEAQPDQPVAQPDQNAEQPLEQPGDKADGEGGHHHDHHHHHRPHGSVPEDEQEARQQQEEEILEDVLGEFEIENSRESSSGRHFGVAAAALLCMVVASLVYKFRRTPKDLQEEAEEFLVE